MTSVLILFLSRQLQPAERNYWATKLEVGALVWPLRKVPQYFDDHDFEVVTDHTAMVTCLQNRGRGRRSARLSEWTYLKFLLTFIPRMTIVHRPGRVYANADGLSRVQGNVGQEVVEEDKALTTDTEAVKRV